MIINGLTKEKINTIAEIQAIGAKINKLTSNWLISIQVN
jgi:hypothetical protein